jgi:hypothetical protein
MPTKITAHGSSYPAGRQTEVSAIDAAVMKTPGLRHFISARHATLASNTISLRCAVSRALVQSFGTAPTLDIAIGGKPTITLGAAGNAIPNQLLRAAERGALSCNLSAFSFCSVNTPTDASGSNILVGGLLSPTGDLAPVIRYQVAGAFTRAPAFLTADMSVARSIANVGGSDVYNTPHILLVTFDTTNGWAWYVNNWSTPMKTDAADKEPLTDGSWQIGTSGSGNTSLNWCGPIGDILCTDANLSLYRSARKNLMTSLAAFYGLAST